MTEENVPRWDLLPHNPEAFFQLPDSFDRRELKRRYNALLRQYKPDKFPEQFQKIRTAYEVLDTRLRYGRQRDDTGSDSKSNWNRPSPFESAADPFDSPSQQRGGATSDPTPQPARQLTIAERLAEEPADAIYRQFKEKPAKSPYDFYVLAILSDLIEQEDPLLFTKWLLTGLHEHPNDMALFHLLRAQFQYKVPESVLEKILSAVAKAAPHDGFYFLSEPLWDQALEAMPFDEFANLLSTCERQLRGHRIEGKVTFMIHILRKAIWKAPVEWREQAFAFLNTNADSIHEDLEYDLEVNSQLDVYHRQREQFLNGNSIRAQLDQAIEDYCIKSEQEADRSVVALQTHMARHPQQMMDAFDPRSDELFEKLAVWYWIFEETAYRVGLEQGEIDQSRVFNTLHGRMVEIDRQNSDVAWQAYSLFALGLDAGATIIFVLILSGITGPLWWDLAPDHTLVSLGIILACIAIGIFVQRKWIKPRTTDRWIAALSDSIARKRYEKSMRPLMFKYFAALHYPFELVLHGVAAVIHTHHNSLGISTWLYEAMSVDYGMFAFAHAQRFLR